ncbi:hypothetical protein JXL19_04985 [bacterium]|nr:hypothetical protein [bacterium]
MRRRRKIRIFIAVLVPFFCFISLLPASFADVAEDKKVYYIKTEDLPRNIAVLPPTFEEADQSYPFAENLIRATLENYLVGKGFSPKSFRHIKDAVKDSDPNKIPVEKLARDLNVDGIVAIHIYSVSNINVALLEYYKVDAEVRLFKADGRLLGKWRDKSSQRKLSVATSPIGAASMVVGLIVSSSGEAQLKNIIYDWAWKISNVLPGLPESSKIPQIIRVVTNIKDSFFKTDDKIAVALQGDKGLDVVFDIGEFKRSLKMIESDSGVYEGIYMVQPQDYARNQVLTIRASKPDGTKREWHETDHMINIDAIPPAPLKDIKASVTEEGIHISWTIPDTETSAIYIFRSDTPIEGFKKTAETKQLQYLDASVNDGATYYYRILGVDNVGNIGKPEETLAVTVPFFQEHVLSGEIFGTLIKGNYRVKESLMIPASKALVVEEGAKIEFEPGTMITLKGELTITGARMKGVEGNAWGGINASENSRLILRDSIIEYAQDGIRVNDASLIIKDTILQTGGSGIHIKSTMPFDIEGVQISKFEKGIVIESGIGKIVKSAIKENGTGIFIDSGDVKLESNNIYGNDVNIESAMQLALNGNYLGSMKEKDLRVKGEITVKTLLDLPFPDGKEMALDSKELEEKVARLKKEALEYFNNGNYGNAYEVLDKVLSLKDDKDAYIYMTFVLEQLGEDEKLEEILKRGIGIYSYEARLYQTYVRYLVGKGRTEDARRLIDKALVLNPGNPGLASLRDLIGDNGE